MLALAREMEGTISLTSNGQMSINSKLNLHESISLEEKSACGANSAITEPTNQKYGTEPASSPKDYGTPKLCLQIP
jgi:hypothetical protein